MRVRVESCQDLPTSKALKLTASRSNHWSTLTQSQISTPGARYKADAATNAACVRCFRTRPLVYAIMFRAAAPRGAVLRPLAKGRISATCVSQPFVGLNTRTIINQAAKIEPKPSILSMTPYRRSTALIRSYASGAVPGVTRRADKEDKFRHGQVEPNPEAVSATSSIHPAFSGEVGLEEEKEQDTDMMAGIRHDMVGESIIVVIRNAWC